MTRSGVLLAAGAAGTACRRARVSYWASALPGAGSFPVG